MADSTTTTVPVAKSIPIPIPSPSPSIPITSTPSKEPGVFSRLVRSISRSSPRSGNPPSNTKHGRKSSVGQYNYSPSLATSPPPGKSK